MSKKDKPRLCTGLQATAREAALHVAQLSCHELTSPARPHRPRTPQVESAVQTLLTAANGGGGDGDEEMEEPDAALARFKTKWAPAGDPQRCLTPRLPARV